MTSLAINRTVRDYQIRINSLNFLQNYRKPVLSVDGMSGPMTRGAIELAMKHFDLDELEDLFDPSGINRLHWHWTASGYVVTRDILKHYNDVFDKDGNHYDGAHPAQQQAYYQPGRVGVSHTLSANTGAVGMSIACMAGASSSGNTVDAGKYPMTWKAIDAMLAVSARYCRKFDIKVSPWTCLTHAEIQPTLGIRQRGKWDIQVLPDDLRQLRTPKEVGDVLRDRLKEMM